MILLIILGVVIFIVLRFKAALRKSYEYANQAAAPLKSRVFSVSPYYKELLEKYFLYYRRLSPDNKRKFEQKVCNFMYAKKFIPRNMRNVPVEMAVFIAATAVQLTFGLPGVYLEHFSTILVYPDTYYSSISKRFHKGEVNPAFGIIVLSWEHFKEGFLHTEDAVNLGLHEMAHALRLENIIRRREYHFFDAELLAQLDAFARKICFEMDVDGKGFFRSYACSDVHEFFSVAVENFFERSADFKAQMPKLYDILVKLLNQDPLILSPLPA